MINLVVRSGHITEIKATPPGFDVQTFVLSSGEDRLHCRIKHNLLEKCGFKLKIGMRVLVQGRLFGQKINGGQGMYCFVDYIDNEN